MVLVVLFVVVALGAAAAAVVVATVVTTTAELVVVVPPTVAAEKHEPSKASAAHGDSFPSHERDLGGGRCQGHQYASRFRFTSFRPPPEQPRSNQIPQKEQSTEQDSGKGAATSGVGTGRAPDPPGNPSPGRPRLLH